MQSTLAKIRKAREFTQEISGWTLRLRRPTDEEASMFRQDEVSHVDIARKFVIGWEKVTEADIINSGSSDPVSFDSELWAELVPDLPELWPGISEAVLKSYLDYREKQGERKKK